MRQSTSLFYKSSSVQCNCNMIASIKLAILYAFIGSLHLLLLKEMETGVGDSTVFDGSNLLAQLLHWNEETSDTDDSFDYLEAEMAEGELYEVSSSCSNAVDSSASDDNGNFGEGSNFA